MISEFCKSTFIESISYSLHKLVVEIQIVHNEQTKSKRFLCFEKMAQISSGISSAYRAVAKRIDRTVVTLIFLVVEIDNTGPGEEMSMPSVS